MAGGYLSAVLRVRLEGRPVCTRGPTLSKGNISLIALERSVALRYNLGMKPAKSLMKQAEKAEAVAQRSEDIEHAERMRNLAEAFRAQAEMLKAKKKKTKVKK